MSKYRLRLPVYQSIVSATLFWLVCFTTAADELPVVIAEPFVELHTGPASEYPVFHVAEKGEQIVILKSRAGWYKARTRKGIEGWISADALNQTLHLDGEAVQVFTGTFEDYAQRDWEMGVSVGLLEDVTAMSASVAWVATPNLVTELTYSQALGDFAENKYWTARIVHYTFPEWRLTPYLSIGAGQLRTNPRANLVASGDDSRTSDIYEIGGGLRYYLSGNMVMRLEYKSVLALTQRDDQEELEEWKLGVTVFF
ncbi:SH3 domain-containing protein [Alteromonas sp. ASW11-36]|uniref:SH3 domain-containing protein n=1 Tax=Alteromonas arenosi TaxID=3055817 RepID=A0ABT7T0V9_9ALTE|nr:SH3 domain-containing protein [Alteromonas sp. ASW11-36]MDM7862020.1 SH3 domain-containing protein [Alteromonas sp. ASW11-36]